MALSDAACLQRFAIFCGTRFYEMSVAFLRREHGGFWIHLEIGMSDGGGIQGAV